MQRNRLLISALLGLAAALIGILTILRRSPDPAPDAIAQKAPPGAAKARLSPLRIERLEPESPAPASEARDVVLVDPSKGSPSSALPDAGTMAIVLEREEVLKQREGLYAYNTRHYGATIEKGGVEIATADEVEGLGSPRLSYKLEEASIAGIVFARGGEAAPTAIVEERAVSYTRGTVEERYLLRKENIEQIFVISELPSKRGDIVITGSVDTNLDLPAEGTRGSRLSFAFRGEERISISEAIAIDATGKKQPLDLTYAAGKVRISVPAEWVEHAALPIVVDPMVGGPITVDGTVTNFVDTVNSQFVRICDVGYNSVDNNWLVVWCERVGSSSFDYNVLGQRVSATGTLVGGAISIATTTVGEYECTVSYSSSANKHLVAWRHDPTNNSSVTDNRITARIVNGDGTMPAAAFTVEDPAGQDYAPSIAFDGTQWFVVYTSTISSTDHNIRGRFVSTTGTLGTSVTVDSATDLGARPSITFGSSVYMIAWEKGPSSGNLSIVARTMSTTGTFPTSTTTVSTATNDMRQADVSFGANKFLILWQHRISGSNRDIYARIATSTLTFDTAALALKTGSSDQVTPRAAFGTTSSEWYVAYADSATGSNIYGFKVGLTGTATNSELVSNNSVTDRRPELAYNSSTNEMLVAFLSGSANPWQVQAQRISMVAPAVPPAPIITTASKKVKSQNPIVAGTAEPNSTVSVYFNAAVDGTAAVSAGGTWSYTAANKSAATYTVKARTNNLAGQSGDSNSISITVDLTAPAVPQNIRTTSYTSAVDVEWDPVIVADLLGYNVSRKTGAGGSWSQLNTTGVVIGTKYRDTTVVTGTTYFYRVTAMDDSLPQ